jgi:hypothetical protein
VSERGTRATVKGAAGLASIPRRKNRRRSSPSLGAELLEVVSWDAGSATVQADESVQQAGHFLERLLLPGKPERGATSRQLDLECVPKDLQVPVTWPEERHGLFGGSHLNRQLHEKRNGSS